MRRAGYLIVAGLLASLAPCVYGQSGDAQQELQQKLTSQFVLSKLTADKSDIITAGSVLVLQKDGLLMDSIVTLLPPLNTYKKGKLSQGFGSGLLRGVGNVMVNPLSNTTNYPERKFLAGEKFWVTSCAIQADGIVFQFYSDPFAGIRYHGLLKFPFPKGQVPPADQALKTIAEVLTVDGTDSAVASSQPLAPASSQPAPSQAEAPGNSLLPIPPPPPPVDAPPPAPKTISLGQTREQVVAIFGQPQKVVKLQTKEIDYYPDMKVTFTNGKVSDVQ